MSFVQIYQRLQLNNFTSFQAGQSYILEGGIKVSQILYLVSFNDTVDRTRSFLVLIVQISVGGITNTSLQ